ncbi:MAG: hypothetical protein UZ05_CHB002000254 [Chlorobi bacterium OLB5]|nr:MAG: hypothetical protein UZ05_CHB002000254 [Chlorobi bacterium OLB5]
MSKKKVITENLTPLEIRVNELHNETTSWFRKYWNVFIELFPLTRKDEKTPLSVKEYKLCENKVDTSNPAINPSMSRVIVPKSLRKITSHLNILSL